MMRRFLAAIVVLAGLIATAAPASAAVRLLSTTPEDGASLQTLDEVIFEFDGLLLPDGAEVFLVRRNGDRTADAKVEVDGARLVGRFLDDPTSGDYEVVFRVFSADGDLNEGSIRVGIDAPEQALSGGLLAVLGIFAALFLVVALVFLADKRRRRPDRRRRARDA